MSNSNSEHNIDTKSVHEISDNTKQLISFLKSKVWYILAITLVGGIIGYLYASRQKTLYKATSTFVLDDGDSGSSLLSNLGGLAAVSGLNIDGNGQGLFSGDNLIELYKSRSMVQKALMARHKSVLLIDKFIEMNDFRSKWEVAKLKNIDFSNMTTDTRLKDSLLGEFVKQINKNYLKVEKQDKKLSIFKVEVSSPSETFSSEFNEEIVRTVNNFYLETKVKKSKQNASILQHKTDSVRRVMTGEIYSASRVLDATPNLNPTRQTQRLAPMQTSQFSSETNKAVLGELVKNLEITKMALLKETPLIQIVDAPIYPLERQVFGKFKGLVLGLFTFFFLAIIFFTVRKNLSN